MLNYVNNWKSPVELAQGATAAAFELPDGAYRITITDADATRWEIIGATVTSGSAALERGLESTDDQGWPEGSIAYIDITAGALEDMQQATADAQHAADSALDVAQEALENSGGVDFSSGMGRPTTPPPSPGALYAELGELLAVYLYLASGDLESEDWIGPLATYTGRRFVEIQAPETVNLPVSVGRVLAHPALEDPPGEYRLRLPAAGRMRDEHMLEFSVSVVADPGSSVVIAVPAGSTAAFSVVGPSVGHTSTADALTIPMQTMELRVSYCRTYSGQLQVHVLVQHLEP